MRRRHLLASVALATCIATPMATAQIIPPPPALPEPPEELRPLLELLAGPAGNVTEPGCAALGTVLGLGTLVIPGLPGTIESSTSLSLSALPIPLQPELLTLTNTLLYVQGSGCGLLPLAAERTVCASDEDLAAAHLEVRRQISLPGLPVVLGDFVPALVPPVGAIVDTFRVLAAQGLPGAAEVVAALEEAADCELRFRLTGVEPPDVPEDAAAAPVVAPGVAPRPPPPALPAFNAVEVSPRVAISAPAPVAAAPVSAIDLPTPSSETLPRWLQWLAAAGLIAFVYRAMAPRREAAR